MFQSLRPNNQVYILHKDKPLIKIGTVVNVSIPTPKYPLQPFGPSQEMVVDLVVKIDNQDITYQRIPANLDIADFGNNNIVISDSKEAMNSEIMCLKQKSLDVINSVEYHQNLLAEFDQIINDLNPEFAEKQLQKSELDSLKVQMHEMTLNMQQMMEMHKQLLSGLGGKSLIKEDTNENVGN